MNCSTTQVPYTATGYFSKLITAYLENEPGLRSFYAHRPDKNGIQAAIKARQQFTQDHRQLLVSALQEQYAGATPSGAVQRNIELLKEPTTFTITTAHQPAIFTGHLYFIYKILHTIRLAEQFRKEWPDYNFVPVFWMGSEDADLDELGHIWLSGDTLTWDTKQKGAVGRMNTKGLEKIIHRIEGELSIHPHGPALVQLLKESYLNSPDIQTATFRLLHALFAEYGLVVIIPDRADLKRAMQPVFEDDLFRQQPSVIVQQTVEALSARYKVQANPRPINLFYLTDGIRELIEKDQDQYAVRNTSIRFSPEQLQAELNAHPERFSPNVILRGLYQETILPNIAFVGGGGETAYWLELKEFFHHYQVPFPVLVLRNSFLVMEKKWEEKMEKLGFSVPDIFRSEQQLLSLLVSRQSNGHLKLEKELQAASTLYEELAQKAGQIDNTLLPHIEALRSRTVKPLQELEKKMLRAEKRKYDNEQVQIRLLRSALFPKNGLQERVANFLPFYAQWGAAFIRELYKASLGLEQEFVVLHVED
ncbi:MAG: bacillithiol biosynthesis cysteine-adding enzyme BshC [Candidatus Pseudobacter hemicellulosilyticus]|uniref:Putative cysteine ligase BshC n=1 Tax=Candidatus Pseudobacter hemicellulosilyticus TaxID=3121375 RepID=A0AAJ5WS27_9BACT|nr:MAG: bacillithiol biosynthesis cysteine-adding enzyme BshC [Pseudobacter sp.]